MSEKHLRRVRRVCATLPETTEKISHGEPTFFVQKKVFAMFANNHHNDGHIAVWLPAAVGIQAMLIQLAPTKFFKPPYVGVRGWVGIELGQIGDEELAFHVREAWRLIAPIKLQAMLEESSGESKRSRKLGSEKESANNSRLRRSSSLVNKSVIARRRQRVLALVQSLPEAAATDCGSRHLSLEVRRRRFGYYLDSHHGDGRIALNLKMVPGVNQTLADATPERFHVPAYLGHRGWVGLWIDLPSIDWVQVEDLLVEAYRLTAPKRLVTQLDSLRGEPDAAPNVRRL